MKKTDANTIEALREHARQHPEDRYPQIANTFGLSFISVKRLCGDLGRGKDWRRGRKHTSHDGDKFWAAVDHSGSGCWQWKGCLNNAGYGFVHFDGKSQAAHRVAYIRTHGPNTRRTGARSSLPQPCLLPSRPSGSNHARGKHGAGAPSPIPKSNGRAGLYTSHNGSSLPDSHVLLVLDPQ
jgi:hypothetical protein